MDTHETGFDSHEENHSYKRYDSDLEMFTEASNDRNYMGKDKLPTDWDKWISIMAELELPKLDPNELCRDDMLNKTFESIEKAELFFTLYANYTGFLVRKGLRRKNAAGEARLRSWMCSREGFRLAKYINVVNRKKEPKGITRFGCKVLFQINRLRKTDVWVVREFQTEHSHDLVPSEYKRFMRSARVVSGGDLQTARVMKASGIQCCQIMSYLAFQLQGYENIPFTIKDLQNKLSEADNKLADVDASRAIGYLQHKADNDIGFFGRFCKDDQDRLRSIFWADSRSRMDYQCFGDAVAFDSTYRTNRYGKPLVVFVGVNHHFSSTVLGFALLIDETVDTYKWVIESFLECMEWKKPLTVITDGDNAMRHALGVLMTGVVHRLCSWHIERNLIKNVKDVRFLQAMQRLMKRLLSPTQFEKEWDQKISELQLGENDWVQSLFDKRASWAETYLRRNFFAGMTTTQRCEGMNALLKKKVGGRLKLYDLVRRLDMSLSWMRHKEMMDDFVSSNSKPLLHQTNMHAIEEQAAERYTRTMFFKVRAEMKREGKYMVTRHEEEDGIITCYLRKYAADNYLRCVTYHKDSMQFECECNMFASKGYPCRHIFSAMKSLEMTKLPENMILSRWTKHAKGMVGGNDTGVTNQMHKSNEASWFGDISHICSDIAWYASRDEVLYRNTKQKLESICHSVRSSWLAEGGQSMKNASINPLPGPSVKNPIFSRSKGSSSTGTCQARKKRCGECKQLGHNKATCKLSKARTAGLKYGGSPDFNDSANIVDSGTEDVQSQQFDDKPTKSNQAENCQDILMETVTPKHMNDDILELGGTSASLATPYENDQSRYSNCWWGKPYGH